MITGCLAAYIVSSPSLAQLSPSPTRPESVIIPADPKTEATMRSVEAQRPAFEAYRKCVAEYRREVDLHYAADEMIRFRDQRATMEAALKQDARARERYPGGVEELIAAAFARYKSVGGTAASVAEVQPVPTPCPTPGLSLRQGSSPSAPSSIRETRRVVVVPAKQPGSPLASAPVGRSGRRYRIVLQMPFLSIPRPLRGCLGRKRAKRTRTFVQPLKCSTSN
jgi:hypothetical protein